MSRSHIFDSAFMGANFAAPDYAAIFDDTYRVQKWLDVEAALAKAQAEIGMIPEDAATEIIAKCHTKFIDFDAVAAEVKHVGHALVPVVRALERACAHGAGEWVHYGTTTQDIVDTGTILQVKDAWELTLRDLNAIRDSLVGHAREHRDSVMVGRTHGQQALPITMGYKIAVWIDELDRHLERMAEAEKRVLVGNMTGAVGSMASFGEHGIALQQRVMDLLGLGAPKICWHSARDRIAELGMLLTQISGTLGKIANEIYNAQRVEVGEMSEPFHHGKVGSSTMPHKQNPSTCELVIALSRIVRGNLMPLTDAVFQEHERDAGMWRIEWAMVPEIYVYFGTVVSHMKRVIAGMRIHPEGLERNLNYLGGLLLSERVMLALGDSIGKQTAHEVVYEVAVKATEEKRPFSELLREDSRVASALDSATLDSLLDPGTYVGLCGELVDGVIGKS